MLVARNLWRDKAKEGRSLGPVKIEGVEVTVYVREAKRVLLVEKK